MAQPGVYISYPFCAQKCSFCNFASGVFPRSLEIEYVAALHAEIRGFPWVDRPDTVYLGGGTPSQMDGAALADLLRAIPGMPWLEATMEAAPGTLTAENVAAWRSAGINRVSLGVQSFDTAELSRTGRKHDAAVVAADCALLRTQGIHNINLDLIAGMPGQTPRSWNESLDWIERIAPPHVSVYLFEVDEDSRLGFEILQGGGRYGAAAVPSDDTMAEMYGIAVKRLSAIGIERYEISNFARPGMESHHNLKYWLLHPYVGFGADAHSFDGMQRVGNVETAQEYVDCAKAGKPPQSESTAANLEQERFFVGLRLLQGIEPKSADWLRFAEPIDRFIKDGLLERDGAILRLTGPGVLLSNEIFQEFVN
ncbi:MAG: radical SAM family heme chaperone HemW [Bryobacteraceae bacterium]